MNPNIDSYRAYAAESLGSLIKRFRKLERPISKSRGQHGTTNYDRLVVNIFQW